MSATGNQPLAKAIYTLRLAAEGLDAPDDVLSLLYATDDAEFSGKPRVSLNRRFGKLRQARPNIFRVLSGWLKTPAVRAHMTERGAYWAWMIWRRAAWKMHRGAKAHVAFGMTEGGRPSSQGFTRADDAAIYALHMLDISSATDLQEAIGDAATIYGARKDEIFCALAMAEAIGAEGRTESVKLSAKKRA